MTNNPLFWFFGIIIPAYLAWWFRDREAKKSLRLKDLRSSIDSINEHIDDIEDLAFNYFLKAGNDDGVQRDGLKIKTKLKSMSLKVNSIHGEINLGADVRDFGLLTKLVAFRRAVTLEDFDTADRVAMKADNPKFEKISAAGIKLREALELVYSNCK